MRKRKRLILCLLSVLAIIATAALTRNAEASAENAFSPETYYLYGDFGGRYFRTYEVSGGLWRYSDTDTFAQIEAESRGAVNLHPGNYGDAIKAFRFTADGTVNLRGSVRLKTNAEKNPDRNVNGIRFSIEKRAYTGGGYGEAQALSENYADYELKTDTAARFDITGVKVNAGDLIALSVNNNGNNDSDGNTTTFEAVFTPDDGAEAVALGDDIGCSVAPIRNYSDEQGKYGWYYAYGTPEKYILMRYRYVYGDYRWTSRFNYQFIGQTQMHPSGKFDDLKIWVSDFDGTISVGGFVMRSSNEGDGAVARLYFNGAKLWEETCDYYGKKTYVIPETRLTVKKGDTVVYSLGTGKKQDEVGDGVEFITNIYCDEITTAYPGSDLSAHLSVAKNEAEILGTNGTEENKNAGCGSGGAAALTAMLAAAAGLTAGKRW